MVDKFVLGMMVADIRDAVARIREMLPATVAEFETNRTAREVVVLNLFVGLQHCLSAASHWLADSGRSVPSAYREVFLALRDQGVLVDDLATRLSVASGLRNLIAHRYGVMDWRRLHEIASTGLDDLLDFCVAIERAARLQ